MRTTKTRRVKFIVCDATSCDVSSTTGIGWLTYPAGDLCPACSDKHDPMSGLHERVHRGELHPAEAHAIVNSRIASAIHGRTT